MSAKTWPKVRKRTFYWQDKSGTRRKGQAWFIDCRLPNGVRYQKTFSDHNDAQADAQRLRAERDVERSGRIVSIANISDDQRLDLLAALKRLDGKATLSQAAEFFMEHNDLPAGTSLTVHEAIDRYVKQSEADGLRPRSITSLRNRLGKLDKAFGKHLLTHVTRADAQAWVDGLRGQRAMYSRTTRNHLRVVAGGLYNWCMERGFVAHNPFASVSKGRRMTSRLEDAKMPGILTVEQATALMNAAAASVPDIAPAIAVGLFAGLRTNEISMLRWEDVSFDLGLITVRPETAKRRRARHVTMEPNLTAWLLRYRRPTGLLAPQSTRYRHLYDDVRKAAGCLEGFPNNGLRHTFASMHFAKHQDAAKTALQLGHSGGINILLDHYRALATPQEAEKFWAIMPGTTGAVVQFGEAASND